ncbi:hypothetical protein [Streptomyces sp. NEAU-S7GS2]|uniref:hypothetical protein n=1 Tax=Streptomyces sp. NEAU-S7GS2 TaxID=2202000 RepID=UPI001EF5B3CE|nr:hypothetical protein [Streptomyces sp. NEAU-S7GS2]
MATSLPKSPVPSDLLSRCPPASYRVLVLALLQGEADVGKACSRRGIQWRRRARTR